MANHISDTELSNLKGQSTEQSMEDSTPLKTNPAYEQDNNTDFTQIEESPKAEVLHCQQDENQWETREELYTILEIFHTMIKTLNHIFTNLTEARNHTVSQQRSTLDYVEKRICFNCRKPGHIARDCRASKTLFNQNQRKVYSQRFHIQQTLSLNLTSHQQKHKNLLSQSSTRRYDGQKQQTGINQPFPSQHNLTFPHASIRPRIQRHNFRRQLDFRSQEFQNNGSNSFARLLSEQDTEQKYKNKTKLKMVQFNFRK